MLHQMMKTACALAGLAVWTVGCATAPPVQSAPPGKPEAPVGLANPASKNCIEKRGRLEIRNDPAGNQAGYCIFTDKSECEEWALMRGTCSPGKR